MRISVAFLVVLILATLTGCGSSTPPPAVAEDPTVSGSARATKLPSCRWVPPLPEEREDVCNTNNKGAELEVVEREDMREESATKHVSMCVCE